MQWFLSLPFGQQIGLLYLLVINVVTFFFYGVDKLKSQLATRRVSEKMLWLLALLGGSPGALIGMSFFRHKTRKLSFQAGIAIILMLQIFLVYYLIPNS